jgi:hypothetical protein
MSHSYDDVSEFGGKQRSATRNDLCCALMQSIDNTRSAGARRDTGNCFGCLMAYLGDCLAPLQQVAADDDNSNQRLKSNG